MIASSRPGTPPSNLQGIWSPHVQPPWGCNYTININTQMNYWPAEVANLSECHQPLFDFMDELAINGAQTAKINYGIQSGWLAHHNSDIWAKSSPAGGEDWDNPKDTHRHISHLFSLYPGNQITPEYTPELAKAAKQTLLHRGDLSTVSRWKSRWQSIAYSQLPG